MAAGLPAMAELLRKHGYDCDICNYFCERRYGLEPSIEEDIRGYDILGLSIHWFYQIPSALEAARRARNASKKVFIVAGGLTASAFPEELLAHAREIDGVIRGDGELPLLKLCGEIASGRRRFESVPNLYVAGKGGKVARSTAKDYVGDGSSLDKLAFGNLAALRNWHYYVHTSSWREITDGSPDIAFDIDTTFYLCGGRGCSVQCVTCGGGKESHKLHSMRSKSFIFRSPARIADDIEAAMRHGYRSFHACFDPAPGGRHWLEVMRVVRKRKIETNFIFECFALPSEKFIREARSTFLNTLLVLSPDTAVEKLRKKAKGFFYTNAQMEKCLELIGRSGLRAQVFFGYFLPGDDEATVEQTLAAIDAIQRRHGDYTGVFYYPFSSDPCSPVVLAPEAHGMRSMVRTFEDYGRELGAEEPLRGNLLRHTPAGMESAEWDLLSLRIELERACARRLPSLAADIRSTLKDKTPAFYRSLAEKLAATKDIRTIPRATLHEHVLHHYSRYAQP